MTDESPMLCPSLWRMGKKTILDTLTPGVLSLFHSIESHWLLVLLALPKETYESDQSCFFFNYYMEFTVKARCHSMLMQPDERLDSWRFFYLENFGCVLVLNLGPRSVMRGLQIYVCQMKQ